VVSFGSFPASLEPILMPSAGIASTVSSTSEPASHAIGRRATAVAIRAAHGEWDAVDSRWPLRRALRL